MYEIASIVSGWHDEARSAVVARVVSVSGFSSQEQSRACALTTGGPTVGSILGSLADSELRPMMESVLAGLRPTAVVDLAVSDDQAIAVGYACGGVARVLVQSSTDLPADVWRALAVREPICLVTDLDGPDVGRTTWFTIDSLASSKPAASQEPDDRQRSVRLFGRGSRASSTVRLTGGSMVFVDALWPTRRLVVVGDGLIAEALDDAAAMLGWTSTIVDERVPDDAAFVDLCRGDAVVVLTHDPSTSSRILQYGLASEAGYVGAIGSRRTQAARAEQLAPIFARGC